MISKPLFKRNISVMWKVYLIILAVLGMYVSVIVYMYNPEISDMLVQYQEAMPQMMSAFGMVGMAQNLLEWMQIYLYGFLMCVFPLIFIIIMGQRLIMHYIDSGSLASLLATPNTRRKIILTQLVSCILWIFILLASVTLIGIVACEIMFPKELDIEKYIYLNLCAFLLQLALTGIAFFSSCIFSEAKHYYLIGAGIPLLSFLIQMISNMGEKLENLKYLSIYTLFPAEKIIHGSGGIWKYNLTLAVMAMLLFAGGSYWFCRRDFS